MELLNKNEMLEFEGGGLDWLDGAIIVGCGAVAVATFATGGTFAASGVGTYLVSACAGYAMAAAVGYFITG
jgi:hypothetical protein